MNTEPDQGGKLISGDSEVVQSEVNLTEIKSDQSLEGKILTETVPETSPDAESETAPDAVPESVLLEKMDKSHSIEPELSEDKDKIRIRDLSDFNERLRSSLSYKGRASSRSISPFSTEPVKYLSTENNDSIVDFINNKDIDDFKIRMMRQSDAFNHSIQERIERERLLILQDEVGLESLGASFLDSMPPYYGIAYAAQKLKITKAVVVERAIKGEIKLHVRVPKTVSIFECDRSMGREYPLSFHPTLLELTALSIAELEVSKDTEVDKFCGGYFIGYNDKEGHYLVRGLVNKVFGNFDDVFWVLSAEGKPYVLKVLFDELLIFRNEVYKLKVLLDKEESSSSKESNKKTEEANRKNRELENICNDFLNKNRLERYSAPCLVRSLIENSDYLKMIRKLYGYEKVDVDVICTRILYKVGKIGYSEGNKLKEYIPKNTS